MSAAVLAFAVNAAQGLSVGVLVIGGSLLLSFIVGFGLAYGAMAGYFVSPYLLGITVRISNLPTISFDDMRRTAGKMPPTPPTPPPPPDTPPTPDTSSPLPKANDESSPWTL